jgi:nicotinamidase-related amidase
VHVLRTLKDRCDPKYGALVMVDMQNDYISFRRGP